MKTGGVIREIDHLGRMVVPIEYRRKLGIETRDPVEMILQGTQIIVRKQVDNCILCGEEELLVNMEGKKLCMKCIDKIKGLRV